MVMLWVMRLMLLAAVLLSAWLGGEPERLVAVVLLAGFALDVVNHLVFGTPAWLAVNPGHLVLDSWVLIILLWVAVEANRGWPLVVAAAQLMTVLGHVAKIQDDGMARRAYWVMVEVPFMLQLVVLMAGTVVHAARARRFGDYPGWRQASSVKPECRRKTIASRIAASAPDSF